MSESADIRSLWLAVAVYVVIFAAKIAAYLASGVMAVFAEALHTLSDIFISGFLLLAAVYSRRQADATHMFGYGRAQNVAALVAATLFISFTSFELYREAIPRLFRPLDVEYDNLPLALGVIVGSMLVAAIPLARLFMQKSRGAAAKAQLMELVNDQFGLAAALVATILIPLGYPLADPIAAIAVATIIAVNALILFRDSASFLLGRSPGPEFLAELERAARSVPGVVNVRGVRAEFVGPDTVHAGLHIEVAPNITVDEGARIVAEVRRKVHERTHPGYCFIETDPAQEPPPESTAASVRMISS
jgi:cation diffusion facilitator family transporter